MSSVHVFRRLSLLAIFTLAQGVFLLSGVFRVTSVCVSGCQYVTPGQVSKLVPIQKGEYMWAYLGQSVTEPILSIGAVESASVSLQPQGKVIVTVIERKPVVQLYSRRLATHWVEADERGNILGPSRPKSTLPRLQLDIEVPPTGYVDSALIAVLMQCKERVEKVLPNPVALYVIDSTQNIGFVSNFLGQAVEYKVGSLANLDYKLRLLSSLIANYKKAGQKLALVDVRFSQPVVRLYEAPRKTAPEAEVAGEMTEAAPDSTSPAAQVSEPVADQDSVQNAAQHNSQVSAPDSVEDDSLSVPQSGSAAAEASDSATIQADEPEADQPELVEQSDVSSVQD